MEENNIQNKKNNPWLMIIIQIIICLIFVGLIFPSARDTGPNNSESIIHTILSGLFAIFSIYSITISIKKFIEFGKNASVGYIILIITSLISFSLSTLVFLLSLQII